MTFEVNERFNLATNCKSFHRIGKNIDWALPSSTSLYLPRGLLETNVPYTCTYVRIYSFISKV